jgi:hypothetical protein
LIVFAKFDGYREKYIIVPIFELIFIETTREVKLYAFFLKLKREERKVNFDYWRPDDKTLKKPLQKSLYLQSFYKIENAASK